MKNYIQFVDNSLREFRIVLHNIRKLNSIIVLLFIQFCFKNFSVLENKQIFSLVETPQKIDNIL